MDGDGMIEPECFRCRKTEKEMALQKCKVCRNFACEDHEVVKSGVSFCSLGCGEYFFHAEPEDEET